MDIESAAVQQEQSKLQLEETQVTLSKPVINDSANFNTNVSQAITQVSKSIKKKKTKKKLRALQAYKPIFAMIEEQLVFLLKGNILLELNRNSDDQDYVPIGFKLNPQNRWNPIQRVIEHTKHQCIEIQVDNALKPIEDFKFIIKVLCSYGDSQYHDIALSLEKYQAIIESTKQIESQQGDYIKGMQQQMLLQQQQQQQQESSQDQSQLYEKPNTELRELTPNHSLLFHSYSQNDLNLSEMLFSPSENSQGIQQTLGYLIGNESFKEHTGYYQNSDNDFGQYIQEQVFFESDEQQSNNIHSSINKQHGEQYKSQQSVPESINIGNSNNNNNTHSYEIPQQQQSLNNNSANMSFYKQFLENQSKNSSNINGKTTATNPLLNKTSKPSPTIEEYEKAFYDQFYLRAMDVLGSMNKGKEQLFFAFTMGKFDKFGFFESMYNFGVNKNFMILLGSEMNSMSNVFMRNGWLEIFDHQTRISNSLNFITLINREYEQHMSQMKNNQSLLMQQMQKNDKNMHGSNTNEQQNTQTKSNAQSKNDPLQEHISESVDIVVNTFDQIKIPAKLSIHDIKVQQFGLRITQIDISPTMIQQVHAIRQKQLASQSHPNYIQMFDRTLTYTQESQAFLEKFYPQKKNKNYKDINELPEVRESIEEMRCGFRQLLSM